MAPEHLHQHDQINPPSHEAYGQSLDELGGLVPEIMENREAILGAGTEIIDTFGLKSELFEEDDRSLVFASIAERWAKLPEGEGGNEAAETERHFLADAVTLLGHDYSDKLDGATEIIEKGTADFDEATRLRAYDRYTDKKLSKELAGAIEGGLLDKFKEGLGVTAESEEPYELRVLSIDHKGNDSLGLKVPQLDYENLSGNAEDKYRALLEHDELRKDIDDQREGLAQRAKDFAKEIGREEVFAPIWVDHLEDGRKIMCISMPLAEKILHPELTTSPDERERDLAKLAHEYVHTQGGQGVEGQFGMNLEEYRAEHFSGNKHGYTEIKDLFSDIRIATGLDIGEVLDSAPKGGERVDVYAALANGIGLERMLEVLLVAPENYANDQSNPFLAEAVKYIGGYDGVLGRLAETEITSGHGAEFEQRLDERLQFIRKVMPDAEHRAAYYEARRLRNINVITDLLVTKDKEAADAA